VPAQLRCRLLFTTRRRDPGSPFHTIDVRVLPEDTALRLLLGSEARLGLLGGGLQAELEAAKAICRTVGYLPLALVLGAAYLGKYPRVSLAGYLNRLRKEGPLAAIDAARVDPRALATVHDAAVEATLRTQWEALENAGARQTLMAAALLGEAAEVPRATLSLLTGLLDDAEEGYAAPLEEALYELSALSLVEELTEKAIRLHPLVREFAEKQIAEREAFAAACSARLVETLWDMGRLHDEVTSRGIYAVLGDLHLGAALAGKSGRERCEQLIRPLDREAHGLRRWEPEKQPGFFLQQLRNQCFELGIEEVREVTEAKLEEQRWPYLRERIRTSRVSEALVRTLEGHTIWVRGVAVTPDGRYAVSASADHTLKVWDLSTGNEIRTLHGHTEAVNGVAVTPDGRLAVSASYDLTLKVWDLSTGNEIRTLHGHTLAVIGVAVTPDGRLAVSASSDQTLKVWDLTTGNEIRIFHGHTGQVTGVAITPDGRLAVSASDDHTLKVWDLTTGNDIRTLHGHTDPVTGVAVTPDSRLAVSASWDNTLKVWDLATGNDIRTFHHSQTWAGTGVAVTPDGRLAVSASWARLKVWDLATGNDIRTLHGHTYLVNGVAVTPDGRLAVSASDDHTLKVWDLSTGHGNDIRIFHGHTEKVNGMAVTPDGRLAVSASSDQTLKVRDLATGNDIRTLHGHTNSVNGVAITPDGRLAVSASEDHTLKVWDLATGNDIRTLHGHTNSVNGVAITPDGRLAVSASWDNTLKVWDLTTGNEIRTLHGHTDSVTGVAVMPNGRLAVSASVDNTLKVWDLSIGQSVATLKTHTNFECCAVTPDGKTLLAGDEVGALHILDWLPVAPFPHR
jgi:WD40 repeat protein